MLLGTVTTVKVLICATILYVIISIIFGLMRLSKNPIIQGVATVYIEFFRGTSLLVHYFGFIMYYLFLVFH
jgi:polar amino acid transport system permease protein